jgi:glycosyltransferase involved in cell wall biosynthesis
MKYKLPLSVIEICAVEFTFRHFLYPLAINLRSRGWRVRAAYNPDIGSSLNLENEREGICFSPILVHRSVKLPRLLESIKSLYLLLSVDDSSLVHVHTPLLSYLVRLLFLIPGFRRSRKLAYTVHGFYFDPSSPSPSSAIHLLLEALLLPVCDCVLFVSREDYNFASPFLGLFGTRCFLVGNGVDTNFFSPQAKTSYASVSTPSHRSSNDHPFTIGFVGRLVREKGVNELAIAFAKFKALHPCSRIVFVGDRLQSDYDSSVHGSLTRISDLFPGSVHLKGMLLDKESLVSCLRSFDVFCLPSYREGLPTSLIEAMSCGVMCIATNVRGCRELISNKQNGLIVSPRSSNEIVSALCYVVTNPQLSRAMASEARSSVTTSYSLQDVVGLQGDIFFDLLLR